MNGLFKAWVAAALPLILNAEIARCPAAAIQVILQESPTISGTIARESKLRDPLLTKFKSDWDYLNVLDSTPRSLAAPDSRSARSLHSNADPAAGGNWSDAVIENAADPAAASNDSTVSTNSNPQSAPNVVPAIVRAPGDGWQTLAAVTLVIAFTAIKRRSSAKSL
jgi:hypothetical protein